MCRQQNVSLAGGFSFRCIWKRGGDLGERGGDLGAQGDDMGHRWDELGTQGDDMGHRRDELGVRRDGCWRWQTNKRWGRNQMCVWSLPHRCFIDEIGGFCCYLGISVSVTGPIRPDGCNLESFL